jgi:hypothetical protein
MAVFESVELGRFLPESRHIAKVEPARLQAGNDRQSTAVSIRV